MSYNIDNLEYFVYVKGPDPDFGSCFWKGFVTEWLEPTKKILKYMQTAVLAIYITEI